MNKLSKKPYLIFWVSIPLITLLGFLTTNADHVTVNVHDTYFVMAINHLVILVSILFGLFGLGYWIILKTKRKLSKWLTTIHIAITFGGILLIWMLAQLFRESIMVYDFNERLTLAICLLAFITVLGQIIYPINMISGLLKKRNETRG